MTKKLFPMVLIAMSFFYVNHLFASNWRTDEELQGMNATLRSFEKNFESYAYKLNQVHSIALLYRKLQFLIEFKEMCHRCKGDESCSELCEKYMDRVNEVLEQRLKEILS